MEYGPIEVVSKLWGREEIWLNELEYCFKVMTLHPGFTASEHYHRIKKETFIVRSGQCFLWVKKRDKDCTYRLNEGDRITILPGQPHRFWLEKEAEAPCVIYEVSTHHSDDDTIRLEVSRQL